MVDTCALMDIRTSQAMDRSRRHHTLQLTLKSHRSLGSGAEFSIWQRSLVTETMTFFSGLGTDVHFSGEETGT